MKDETEQSPRNNDQYRDEKGDRIAGQLGYFFGEAATIFRVIN
jgi:hypothetical protein